MWCRGTFSFAIMLLASVSIQASIDNDTRFKYQRVLDRHVCLFQPLLPSTRSSHETRTHRRRHYQDERLEREVPIETTSHKEYDPVTDWTPPPLHVVQQTIDERIAPLRRLTSPVFFSTNSAGRKVRGLGFLPNKRPLLIVGNHLLGGLDIWLIVPELIQHRDLFVRGLGHPVIFHDAEAHLKGGPTFLPDSTAGKQGTFGLYQKFGAVMATPTNMHRLLETNQVVLHFPGGAREAYHGREEAHTLFWPIKVDFVRMAAKFNATIFPMSAIGASDSVYMLADPEELLKLPFGLNTLIANSLLTVREAARYDERQDEYIRPPPMVLPKILPSRHYFMFGKPFGTQNVDPKDRNACRKLYQDIQTEMKQGFDDLLRGRQQDPFKDSIKRFAYEQVIGKQAPSFSVNVLNAQ